MSAKDLHSCGNLIVSNFKLVSHLINSDKLNLLVQDFFRTHNIKFGILYLNFRDLSELDDEKVSENTVFVGRLWHSQKRIDVFVAPEAKNAAAFFYILAHEFDHRVWEIEGKDFNLHLPLDERPEEK